MDRVITASRLRTELSQLLDQLDNGTSHFIIERNNQASAVLLSIEKFRDIMQMLEMLNALEFIGPNDPSLEDESDLFQFLTTSDDGLPLATNSQTNEGRDDSPSLVPLPANPEKERQVKTARTESVEEAAAKRGIRLIK
jgi:PHD/YefM family antitoxin component YafN of YafNO toxin-antitoxin module